MEAEVLVVGGGLAGFAAALAHGLCDGLLGCHPGIQVALQQVVKGLGSRIVRGCKLILGRVHESRIWGRGLRE